MGKIKIRTIGTEEEQAQKSEQKKKLQEKKRVHLSGMGGGQRVALVGPTEEELAKLEEVQKVKSEPELKLKSRKARDLGSAGKKDKFKKVKPKHSKKYQTIAKAVEKSKNYKISEALALLEKLKRGSFDETVELHVNTTGSLSGQTTLPHGTGKKTRVAIADDSVLLEIEKEKINFDILIAHPSMMGRLAKVAKILGPRGLMPNPKSGTISSDPLVLAKKYEGGQLHFKTETKAPILHITVGRLSFGEKKLSDNIQNMLDAIKKENIQKAVLKSTMSPGIKIELQ